MCMVDDGDAPEASVTTTPKAAKPYVCGECRRTIEKGERYLKYKMLYEGTWIESKHCLHCHQLASWLVGECGGFPCDQLIEDFEQHAIETKRFDMMRQLWGAKHKWQRRGQLMPVPKVLPTTEERATS